MRTNREITFTPDELAKIVCNVLAANGIQGATGIALFDELSTPGESKLVGFSKVVVTFDPTQGSIEVFNPPADEDQRPPGIFGQLYPPLPGFKSRAGNN